MNIKSWSPQEREEYAALCEEAWRSGGSTTERTVAFQQRLLDAQQAQRFYAADVLAEAQWRGLASILKGWAKDSVPRLPVAYNGRVLAKPRVVGTTEVDDDGKRYDVQTLFDYLTFEQIEQKVASYLKQVTAYRENIHVGTRLLELRDLVPEATTPAEAVEALGTTVDAFLADERAA